MPTRSASTGSGSAGFADGAILVADSYNHCIRKIENDQVTTFAGKCTEPGYLDVLEDEPAAVPAVACTGAGCTASITYYVLVGARFIAPGTWAP
jgi:hypothetical protein